MNDSESNGPFSANWRIALALAAGVLFLFLIFPYPGSRKWDGWMAGSVIANWSECSWSEVFFFAHPLVAPITKLFAVLLPTTDGMLIATAREVVFSALSAALVYLLFATMLRSRFAGVVVTLAFVLSFEFWRLATRAEEKSTMLFFLLLVVLPFFHLRGWVHFTALARFGRRWLVGFIGVALALSVAVHLQNILLFPFVGLATVFASGFATTWRRDTVELLLLFAVAGALTVAFFLPVAWFAIGVRDWHGFTSWLGEYHLSGQFVDTDYTFAERVLEAYTAFREYVFGWHLPEPGPTECVMAIWFGWFMLKRAWRANRDLCMASGVFLALLTLHFFNYRQESEPWAGASVAGLTILALGSFATNRPVVSQWTLAPWMSLLAVLLVSITATYRLQTDNVGPLSNFNRAHYSVDNGVVSRYFQSHLPEAQVAQRVDATVETDAIILTGWRHVVNAFRVYTDRGPIVARYLDRDEEFFSRSDVALTVLSRHFYIPDVTSDEVRRQAEWGVPVYLLTGADAPSSRLSRLLGGQWQVVTRFGYRNWKLFRWREEQP